MAPKSSKTQVKELLLKYLNLHEQQLEKNCDPWQLTHLSLLPPQLEGALHTSDPGRTHWKTKLQLRWHEACKPRCPLVLMAKDLAKLSDVPALRRGMQCFRIKKCVAPSTGHWLSHGSLQTPWQNKDIAAGLQNQTAHGAFAIQSWMAGACWPTSNTEVWPQATDQKHVTTALMPLCVLSINPENGDNVSSYGLDF